MSEETATTPETSETDLTPSEETEETETAEAETEVIETTIAPPEPKPNGNGIPTIEELLESNSEAHAYAQMMFKCARRAGKSKEEAQALAVGVRDAFEAATEPAVELDSKGEPIIPHFLVFACTPRGSFWRAGRKFNRVPQKLLIEDLTEAEIKLFEGANPQALSVIRVGG